MLLIYKKIWCKSIFFNMKEKILQICLIIFTNTSWLLGYFYILGARTTHRPMSCLWLVVITKFYSNIYMIYWCSILTPGVFHYYPIGRGKNGTPLLVYNSTPSSVRKKIFWHKLGEGYKSSHLKFGNSTLINLEIIAKYVKNVPFLPRLTI